MKIALKFDFVSYKCVFNVNILLAKYFFNNIKNLHKSVFLGYLSTFRIIFKKDRTYLKTQNTYKLFY